MEIFRQYLKSKTSISDEQFSILSSELKIRQVSKGEVLLIANTRMKFKDEFVDTVKTMILNDLIDSTRKEEGCIKYNVHQSEDDSNVFTFHETWKNKDGFNFHMRQPYVTDFLELVKDKLVNPLLLVKGHVL
ncbi:putative quinol monooxygenase [Pedobacter antarcticus]|uniref:putative quinol monooxygenase n=1 Tax=Pedobacter antarcticus TaxID=34086 RepID=UPI00292DDCDB|nr:putative quinol monooxygenase [Pedobacter antarcticus]